MDIFYQYLCVFCVGGLLCAIAQLLIIKTKLTPARILIIFLMVGILLQTIGVYKPILDFAHSGISVPIVGFGAALARGAIEFVDKYGPIGAFGGGLSGTAFGIGAAMIFSYIISLLFTSKTK